MSVQLKIQYLPHYQSTWERIHYKHTDDSGFDLRAAIDAPVILKAHEIRLIPCGIKIEMAHDSSTPYFYELQILFYNLSMMKRANALTFAPCLVKVCLWR